MGGKQKTTRIKPRRLKGFRDITAGDMLARERMIARIREVYESYGFVPLETPALEYVVTRTTSGSPCAMTSPPRCRVSWP